MLLRCSRNVMAAVQTVSNVSTQVMIRSSIFLSFAIHTLLSPDFPLVADMMQSVDAFDCATFLQEIFTTLPRSPDVREFVAKTCDKILEDEAAAARVVKRRSGQAVHHFIGMIFQHRMYDYTGVIYGWDVSTVS